MGKDEIEEQTASICKQRDAIQKMSRESSSGTNVSLVLVSYFASIGEEVDERASHDL